MKEKQTSDIKMSRIKFRLPKTTKKSTDELQYKKMLKFVSSSDDNHITMHWWVSNERETTVK